MKERERLKNVKEREREIEKCQLVMGFALIVKICPIGHSRRRVHPIGIFTDFNVYCGIQGFFFFLVSYNVKFCLRKKKNYELTTEVKFQKI